MALINFLSERIVLPASDMVFGQKIKNNLSFLLKSQWWTLTELEDFQNKQLNILIKQAYENVPYYNEVMKERNLKPDDIKTISDLHKLPILTKEIYKQNYPHKLRAANWRRFRTLSRSSSGSTGTPIQYLMTRYGYGFNKACHIRGWYWMGFRVGDPLMKISQNQRKTFEKHIQDRLSNTFLFSLAYTNENIKQFITDFNKLKPEYIRSYPDPLQFLASMLKAEGRSLKGIKAINTTGNILFPEIRKLIQDTFNTEVFDTYSCEGGPNFFECSTHECYHSSMEYGVSEILNEKFEEVKPGEEGHLFTTDLWNYVSPFIRYDSKDIVVKAEKPCSCGRNLLGITKVIGRDNDIIVTPSGKHLIAQTFTTFFKYIPSIIQFQIFQERLDHVLMKLKVDSSYNGTIQQKILDYWQDYMGKEMNITIEITDEIPLTTSGKRRFLLRNNNIPLTI